MTALDVVLLLAAYLAALAVGEASARLRQPRVLGELLAGALMLAVPAFHETPALEVLAKAGVALLLFETGLHTDVRGLLRSGPTAAAVAAVGVAAPFALGTLLMTALGAPTPAAVFVGAALTATSVGVTARVLEDLGLGASAESRVIMGAAVIDDVIGVVVLAALGGTAAGAGVWFESALVVGSFAAGAALSRSRSRPGFERAVLPAARALSPFFFVAVGASIDLGSLSAGSLALAAALTVAAVAGKLASGLPAKDVDRWTVGLAMVPRGEVGLVFAQIGLASGVLLPPQHAALVAAVAATTFLGPLLLKRRLA